MPAFPSRQPAPFSLRRELEKHFLFCSAIAAGCAGTEASETIVHRSLSGAGVPVDENSGIFFDLDTATFSIGTPIAGYDLNLFEQAGTQLLQIRLPANGVNGAAGFSISPYTYVTNVAGGTTIGPGNAPFVPYGILAAVDGGGNHGQFVDGGSNLFLGLRFSTASNTTVFGWARLTVRPSLVPDGSGNVASITDFAYESNGGSIMAGQIPEPGSLGMLALGAVGVAAMRRARGSRPPESPSS